MIAPIDSTWVTSYFNSIDSNVVSVTIFKNIYCKFNDLELGQFEVIHGQSS